MQDRPLVVSVVGAAQCSREHAQIAQRVGFLVASQGVYLVCGGGGGVMEAACRGCAQAGGHSIGLLPGNDRALGNRFLSVALPTGLGQARNALVVLAGQAVIAIGGAYGTLSEIALALRLGRRVVGLDTWHATDHEGAALNVLRASSPEEAVELALRSISPHGGE